MIIENGAEEAANDIALSSPPWTISGGLADYAKQAPRPAASLDLLMDDQQQREAGVHPEQTGAGMGYSVIDATASGEKAGTAGGYAKAIGLTRSAVTKAHSGAAALGQAPIIAKGIGEAASHLVERPLSLASLGAAGKIVGSAVDEAGKHPVVVGLKTLNGVVTPPLYAAESLARGLHDARNGHTDRDTLTGNLIRGMVVTGASINPVAAMVANKYLPDGYNGSRL